jgi:hypothetical protein
MPTVTDRLTEWGAACRTESERLSLPQISQIQVMIDHVRLEDRLHKGVRRRRMVERVTAKGKQTKAARKPTPIINSKVLEVDYIIAKMPGWMQSILIRAYLYGQPDRRACQDLRMPKEVYRLRRLAAEEYVETHLAKPFIGGKIPRNAAP